MSFINQASELRDGNRVDLLRIAVPNLHRVRVGDMDVHSVIDKHARCFRVIVFYDINTMSCNFSFSADDSNALIIELSPIRTPFDKIVLLKLITGSRKIFKRSSISLAKTNAHPVSSTIIVEPLKQLLSEFAVFHVRDV